MIRALKVVMIVWSVIGILYGLAFAFISKQFAAIMGFEPAPAWVGWNSMMLGICGLIVPCVFILIAARDPLKHIPWVQFATVWAVLWSAVHIYAFISGMATFNQFMPAIVVDGGAAIALLILYPWRAQKGV